VRETADGEVSQARAAAQDAVRRAEGEVTAARRAAADEVARACADAENARREARAAMTWAVSTHLVTIPIPPLEVRAESWRVEKALNALHQIDYVLEVGMLDAVESPRTGDVELIRRLVWTVQEEARDLPLELSSLAARYSSQVQTQAADGYAKAAGEAYREFLERIDVAVQRLRSRNQRADAEVVEAVWLMPGWRTCA
jgi:colicin import membrane protein